MYCSKCRAEVSNDVLVCPVCMERIAAKQQSMVVSNLKEKQRGLVSKIFKSPVFIVYAVCITMLLVLHMATFGITLVDVIDGDIFSIGSMLTYAGLMVVPLLGTINSWKLVGHNPQQFEASKITSVSGYSVFWRIMMKLQRVFFAIIMTLVVSFAVLIVVAVHEARGALGDIYEILHEVDADEALEMFEIIFEGIGEMGFFMIILLVLFTGGMIFFYSFVANIYDRITYYYTNLRQSYVSGDFMNDAEAPCVSLYVLAGIFFLFGIVMIPIGLLTTSLLYFANVIFLIITAIFFQYSEKTQNDNLLILVNENNKLTEINRLSTNIIAEKKRQERLEAQKQELATKAKEEALKAEELKTQKETAKAQQDMMQQMMMAMLQQNMMNVNANANANANKNAAPNMDAEAIAKAFAQMQANMQQTPVTPTATTEAAFELDEKKGE